MILGVVPCTPNIFSSSDNGTGWMNLRWLSNSFHSLVMTVHDRGYDDVREGLKDRMDRGLDFGATCCTSMLCSC